MHRVLIMSAFGGCALVLAGSSAAPLLGQSALDPYAYSAGFCGSDRLGSRLLKELVIASATAAPASQHRDTLPLYSDLTSSPFQAGTDNAQAQAYFSQGLLLTYGFNHAGAVRSFRQAQTLDPDCALCWWGEALALGPNINAPMDQRDRSAALIALQRAQSLAPQATQRVQDLIAALAKRYSDDPLADRVALDLSYARAMTEVAQRFPADDDIAVLAAEALMDTSPWNYWQADKRTPLEQIAPALGLLETVMARSPDHVQATHLYIHLLEASDPQRAEAAADRLSRARPASSGHLVHMPAHIYMRRGRLGDSLRLNVDAARADEAFIRSTGDQGLVRYGYYPHNIHFIVASAQMGGDMDTAIRESQRLRRVLDPETSARIAWVQVIDAAPYLTLVQYADPQAVLSAPAPDNRLTYARAMRHYARAVAYARLNDTDGYDREIIALAQIKASGTFDDMIAQGVPALDLISLAELMAYARRATALGQHDQAVRLYEQAAVLEATIPYMEPAYWPWPVQQSLGAALIQAGRPAEAKEAFRQALMQSPNNGWALYGLAEAETALGNRREAARARQAFRQAWLGNPRWLRLDYL